MKKNSFSDYDLTTLKPKSSIKTKVEDLNYPTFANTLNMTKSTLKEESQKENDPNSNFVTDQNEVSIQKKERSVNKFSSFQK